MGQGMWPGRRVNATDISGIMPVAKGGTGASDAAGARTNLGVASGAPPEQVLLGTGDGSTLTFNFAVTGVVCTSVLVAGIVQSKSVWSISVGTGPAGVDQLVFSVGNAPPNGSQYAVEALISL
jgi:hypothetical protein